MQLDRSLATQSNLSSAKRSTPRRHSCSTRLAGSAWRVWCWSAPTHRTFARRAGPVGEPDHDKLLASLAPLGRRDRPSQGRRARARLCAARPEAAQL